MHFKPVDRKQGYSPVWVFFMVFIWGILVLAIYWPWKQESSVMENPLIGSSKESGQFVYGSICLCFIFRSDKWMELNGGNIEIKWYLNIYWIILWHFIILIAVTHSLMKIYDGWTWWINTIFRLIYFPFLVTFPSSFWPPTLTTFPINLTHSHFLKHSLCLSKTIQMTATSSVHCFFSLASFQSFLMATNRTNDDNDLKEWLWKSLDKGPAWFLSVN